MNKVQLIVTMLVLATGVFASPRRAAAQPAGDQMCGDGTTFTVNLPGASLGIDDSTGFWRNIDVPTVNPADTVTLPNGCRIYAILVSGFNQNAALNEIIFYKLAEFVAANDGYVHVSWWNNFLKQYMNGVVHNQPIRIRRLFGLLDDVVINPTPGNGLLSFVPTGVDLPKANPDEDYQFQNDAARVIRAIRAHNPDAIIVVAGHSMGGDAVARLGMTRDLEIDLLAPIDPTNNRDKPAGLAGTLAYNWTRWRSNHDFRGYREWDCVRNGIGLCRDFDSRLLYTSYQCGPTGPYLDSAPSMASRAPIICPRDLPYADAGTLRGFGSNIKHLYHRFQQESAFPFDFIRTERYLMHGPLTTTNVLGPNYQRAFAPTLFGGGPNDTCRVGTDPNDARFGCDPLDGHGEIIGQRGIVNIQRPGLALTDPPSNAAGRKAALLRLPTDGANWSHRPVNPDLCLVCDDMITIVQHLLDEQPNGTTDTTAPSALLAATPGPNDEGWNNEDVVLDFTAQDEAGGSGVAEIETTLSGAQNGTATTAGATAQRTVIEEGTTTVSYFARDEAGNVGEPSSLVLNVDRTPPAIEASAVPPPNDDGWNNTDVTVTFTATDALSGLASVSPAVTVSAEEGNREVVGTASDIAGNDSTATALVSIDKTAPEAVIEFDPQTLSMTVRGRDALSGVSNQAIAPESIEPLAAYKAGFVGTHEIYAIRDRAGNTLRIGLDVWRGAAETRANVTSLDYGSGAQGVSSNSLRFIWAVSNDVLRVLEQSINSNYMGYSAKRGDTLNLLRMVTDGGVVKVEGQQ